MLGLNSDSTDPEILSVLLAFVQSEGRVCPQPISWADFWKRFAQLQRQAGQSKPPDELKPLVLNGWWLPDSDKQERFLMQLAYIHEHGRIAWASEYLRGLDSSDWHYS